MERFSTTTLWMTRAHTPHEVSATTSVFASTCAPRALGESETGTQSAVAHFSGGAPVSAPPRPSNFAPTSNIPFRGGDPHMAAKKKAAKKKGTKKKAAKKKK